MHSINHGANWFGVKARDDLFLIQDLNKPGRVLEKLCQPNGYIDRAGMGLCDWLTVATLVGDRIAESSKKSEVFRVFGDDLGAACRNSEAIRESLGLVRQDKAPQRSINTIEAPQEPSRCRTQRQGIHLAAWLVGLAEVAIAA
jgi:hypothetical protein